MNIRAAGICLTREGRRILDRIDLGVKSGGVFVVMGPTGCGKTSLLRVLALLERPDSGTVSVNGTVIPDRGKSRLENRRSMAMLFQRPVLFGGSVFSNIAWGLRIRGAGREEIQDRVEAVLEMVGLEGFAGRSSETLSGGEIQRTALARALVIQPDLLILDEPTASLDPPFRNGLRRNLSELHRRTGTTFLMATHDFQDALRMGTDGAVMSKGRIEETGSIEEIFYRPSSRLAAEFIGIENIIPVKVLGGTATAGGMEIVHGSEKPDGRFLAIPAEAIVLSREQVRTSERNRFPGTIVCILQTGRSLEVSVDCSGIVFVSRVTQAAADDLGLEGGSDIWISFKASAVHVF